MGSAHYNTAFACGHCIRVPEKTVYVATSVSQMQSHVKLSHKDQKSLVVAAPDFRYDASSGDWCMNGEEPIFSDDTSSKKRSASPATGSAKKHKPGKSGKKKTK